MRICVTNWKSDDLPNLSELTKFATNIKHLRDMKEINK